MEKQVRFGTFWHNLLTSGQQEKPASFYTYSDLSRIKFVNACLIAGCLISLIMLMIQIVLGAYSDLLMYIIPAVMFLVSLAIQRRYIGTSFAPSFILIVFAVSMLFGVVSGGFLGSGLFVHLSFPILAFFMFGRKGGLFWVTGFILVYCGIILVTALGFQDSYYSPDMLIIGGFNFLIITVFTYFNAERHEKIEWFLKKQVYFDDLTGLPNRTKLLEDLEASHSPVLVLVNVDDFKEINGIFGYREGDKVLRYVGEKIAPIASSFGGSAYRLAGDEFALIMPFQSTEPTSNFVRGCMENLQRDLDASPYRLDSHELNVRVSAGIAAAEIVGKDDLFPCADIALKTAKQTRRSFLFYFEAKETREQYKMNLQILTILSQAVAQDRIIPFYQPIMNNATNQIEKYEALIRITDGNGKIITPAFFLDVAKKSRIYPKLTRTMLRKSVDTFKDSGFDVSINLSIQDFQDPYVMQFIDIMLSRFPGMGPNLYFEITESEGIENYNTVSAFIKSVKSAGCKVAIDDFGTGYSNFDHIINLNVDFIKVDGTLVRNIDTDKGSRIVVENIVKFSRELGIQTIAEYVHSEKVFTIIREIGIDFSQGYLIGEPRPVVGFDRSEPS